ncbi:MAG: S8 family serine peptidase [Desulfobulbaceae bacterium]|nr:S8 family serine peptidase [Desulfobulbaceae bacterium]
MARKLLLCLGIVFSVFFVLCAPAASEDRILMNESFPGGEYVPGEIVVKFNPGVSEQQIAAINARHGAAVISTSRFAGFKRLKVPRGRTVSQMAAVYSRNPNVEYAEPNFIAHASFVPDDPYYRYQWHLQGISMEQAWEMETGSSVVVAVIDTGVAYENHTETIQINRNLSRTVYYSLAPDLANTSFVPGYDFVNDDEHPNDDEGHGTHVAGTIAQSTNNGTGVAGVAFGSSIMPVKVLNSSGSGTYTDIADGIYFAADNGADVINMSLGGSSGSITLENALAYAYGKGVTSVCASGNDGSTTTISFPAAYDAYCIAVGATRYDETVAYYSNRGASLDLTAPGGDINVDQNGDGYGDAILQQTHDGKNYTAFNYYFYQGTSMATPHVSGVAALLVAGGAATTPDQVREVLQSTAKDKGPAGWDKDYGWGIVDAYAALNYASGSNTQPVAADGGPYAGTEDLALQFDGAGSSDDDGDPLTYFWDFGDGTSGSGEKPEHIYTAGGDYTVALTVNDGKTDSLPSATTAAIAEVNDPPVADAGLDLAATAGAPVILDGSGSFDEEDGSILAAYDWDFGDDSRGSGMNVTHTYAAAGIYTATLTATDSEGLTGTDTSTITVTEAAAYEMHVAGIDLTVQYRKAGKNKFTSAAAVITISDGNGSPVEGAAVSTSWSGATSDVDSGVTDAAGTVTVYSNEIKNPPGGITFTCTVDNVMKTGWTYSATGETTGSITIP